MSILVDNSGYGLTNLGDLSMLQVGVARLRELAPRDDLKVITTSPDRLKMYVPGAEPVTGPGRALFHQGSNLLGAAYWLGGRSAWRMAVAESWARRRRPFQSAAWAAYRMRRRGIDAGPIHDYLGIVADARAVVATGGGFITDSFESHAMSVLELLGVAKALRKPIALFGQGLGPIDSPKLRRTARSVLQSADLIALREERQGLPLLKSLGVRLDRVVVTGDDAVERAYDLRQPGLGEGLGFNLRLASYSGVDDAQATVVRDVVKQCAAEMGMPLLPVPIDCGEGESDVRSLGRLLNLEDESAFACLTTPDDVIRQVGRCRLVVTGSYHAGVFALSQGIPVVGLAKSAYYRGKFLGLADQFGCSLETVELGNGPFEDALKGAIRRSWDNADSLRQPLLQAAERQVAAGHEAYHRFIRLLEPQHATA